MQQTYAAILNNYIHKIQDGNTERYLGIKLSYTGSACYHLEFQENGKEISFIGLVYFPGDDGYTLDKVGVRLVSEHFGLEYDYSEFLHSDEFEILIQHLKDGWTSGMNTVWLEVKPSFIAKILSGIRDLYLMDLGKLDTESPISYGFNIHNFEF